MEGKKGFILYTNKKYLIEALTNEQAGILIKHIFEYVNDKFSSEEEDLIDDPVIKMAWLAFKADLKEDLTKWKNICERNRVNGSKGGRPKNENPKNPLGNLETQKNPKNPEKPKKADIDIDSDIEIDIDSDIKKKCVKEKADIKSANKPAPSRFTPPTLEEITAYCYERHNNVDSVRFYNFYQSKGWYVGKNKMKDWKAAVRTWEKEDSNKSKEIVKNSPLDLENGGIESL